MLLHESLLKSKTMTSFLPILFPFPSASYPEAVAAQAALGSNPVNSSPKAAGPPQAPRSSKQCPQLAFQESRLFRAIPGAPSEGSPISLDWADIPGPGRHLRQGAENCPSFFALALLT